MEKRRMSATVGLRRFFAPPGTGDRTQTDGQRLIGTQWQTGRADGQAERLTACILRPPQKVARTRLYSTKTGSRAKAIRQGGLLPARRTGQGRLGPMFLGSKNGRVPNS